MKARVPDKTTLQQIKAEYDKKLEEAVNKAIDIAHEKAIELCIVTRLMADIDSGLAESTVLKTTKRWQSYIDSVHSGNVTVEEIKATLEEEHGMKFDWSDNND